MSYDMKISYQYKENTFIEVSLKRAADAPNYVNALLGCHDLALSCCREIARISVMEWSL